MANSCTTNEYFSGQGSVLIATKNATTGDAEGFVPVGNVSALTLGIETTVFEHKESCSGTRGVDKQITQEVKVNVSMTLESLNKENLSLAMYGTDSIIAAGSVTDEAGVAKLGKWIPFDFINVSTVVVTNTGAAITYVLGDNYDEDLAGGQIYLYTTAEQTAAGAADTIVEDQVLEFDYSHTAQDKIEGVTSSSAPERWLRFVGLNTADGDKPVTVDIYKLSVQPLAELALINEELAEMTVEGAALTDNTRSTGSTYFTVNKVSE